MTQVSRVSRVKFIQKGESGKPGPILYPAGVWNKDIPYTRTAETTPFVLYDTGNTDDQYYYLAREGTFTGVDPFDDYIANDKNGTWIRISSFNAVYTKILMADFALVGGAVFHNNKMMSQKGTNAAYSYKDFQEDAAGKPSGDFNPNFYVDLETGYLQTNDVEIKGGKIGDYKINKCGLYYGDPTQWKNNSYKQDMAHLIPGQIRLQRQSGILTPGNIANVKVAIGDGADPSLPSDKTCYSAGYFYRQMNPTSINDFYMAAVKIISDNVVNRDVALYTKGAVVCDGGMAAIGHFINTSTVNLLDFSFGTTVVVSNSTSSKYVYLPTLSNMRLFLNTTGNFCIPVTIIAQYDNTHSFNLGFNDGDSSLYFRNGKGNKWKEYVSMSKGNALSI